MIPSGDWLTPTRFSGIAAYGLASACCGVAWAKTRTRSRSISRIAAWLAAIEILLLLDILTNFRWMLHGFFADFAARHHEYDSRRPPQAILDALLVVLLAVGIGYARRRFRITVGLSMAVCGAMISTITWCVEIVSLHQVDTILYRPIGRWMAISLIWASASAITSAGILFASRRTSAWPS